MDKKIKEVVILAPTEYKELKQKGSVAKTNYKEAGKKGEGPASILQIYNTTTTVL